MKLRRILQWFLQPLRVNLLIEQNKFILSELQRINEINRKLLLNNKLNLPENISQTKNGFNYQWNELPDGVAMPDDHDWFKNVKTHVCEITQLDSEWFVDKTVADVGCGRGRYTHALLSLGCSVTAYDQSECGLQRTVSLCEEYKENLRVKKFDLLDWEENVKYDLIFCFGVVHHTGNTYRAIINAANKVKKDGKFFLMVYGFPQTLTEFREVNNYIKFRKEFRNSSFKEIKKKLISLFGKKQAHGWFDAITPDINDLLTYEEIVELLRSLGFKNIKRTIGDRNIHVIADKVGK